MSGVRSVMIAFELIDWNVELPDGFELVQAVRNAASKSTPGQNALH